MLYCLFNVVLFQQQQRPDMSRLMQLQVAGGAPGLPASLLPPGLPPGTLPNLISVIEREKSITIIKITTLHIQENYFFSFKPIHLFCSLIYHIYIICIQYMVYDFYDYK